MRDADQQNNKGLAARIAVRGGTPILEINGRPARPLMFFFNTEADTTWKHTKPQVRLAASAGVHIYSFPLPWPWFEPDVEPDFSEGERYLEALLELDPDALFVPRMRCEGSDEWLSAHPEARIVYADGSSPLMSSAASELWWETLCQGLARAIRHYEDGPFGDHFLGYHAGGQNSSEWFHYEYWIHGPDYSPANQAGFRRWLAGKYQSDDVLREAWNRSEVSLDAACVPAQPGVEPHQGTAEKPFRVFLSPTAEQDQHDFHDYTSHVIADRLAGIARLIKKETDGRKLPVLFYGYVGEMHGAISGHFAMEELLACPDVSIVASPISYIDRQSGGSGSFMTAVDSLPLNGKMWVVENDTRTHSLDLSSLPSWLPREELYHISQSLEETLALLAREYDNMLSHRCGTWWMDLIGAGAYSDPAVWEFIRKRHSIYDELIEHPVPYHPDVAVIIDEASLRAMRYPAIDGLACYNPVYDVLLRHGRDVFGRSGASIGWYYLGDFLHGKTPECKVYWFMNAFAVHSTIAEDIRGQLDKRGGAVVWQYAPGFAATGKEKARIAKLLTGFDFASVPGPTGSIGAGPLDGLRWGQGYQLDPRLVAVDPWADCIATYIDGAGCSAAVRRGGPAASVFVGDILLTPEVTGRLLAALGVHTETGDHDNAGSTQ